MSHRRLFGLLVVRWGFAVLVALAIATGLAAAITVTPPKDVPTVALQAAALYRVEVGAAVFFGPYIAALAFALALQNRGFTEIGSGGIRARDLASMSEAPIVENLAAEIIDELIEEMEALQVQRERMQDVYRAAD